MHRDLLRAERNPAQCTPGGQLRPPEAEGNPVFEELWWKITDNWKTSIAVTACVIAAVVALIVLTTGGGGDADTSGGGEPAAVPTTIPAATLDELAGRPALPEGCTDAIDAYRAAAADAGAESATITALNVGLASACSTPNNPFTLTQRGG